MSATKKKRLGNPQTRTCPLCGATPTNWANHRQRCKKCRVSGCEWRGTNLQSHGYEMHKQQSTVELATDICQVLQECGIDTPVSWAGLDLRKMVNLRLLPSIQQDEILGTDHPQLVADEGQKSALPSCIDLIRRVIPSMQQKQRKSRSGVPRKSPGRYFTYGGLQRIDPIPVEKLTEMGISMAGNLLCSEPDMILGAPIEDFIPNCKNYELANMASIRECYPVPDVSFRQVEANITPKGSRVRIHHDEDPCICTAKSHPSNRPAKLWLLFPPAEALRLGTRYSNDEDFLQSAQKGFFIVQLDGESVKIPAYWPHATISLSDCTLIGQVIDVEDVQRVIRMLEGGWLADYGAEDNLKRALVNLTHDVCALLENNRLENAKKLVRPWMSAYGWLAGPFRQYPKLWEEIRSSWLSIFQAEHCLFCREFPFASNAVTPQEHLDLHFPIHNKSQRKS